jgi:hypothetical protein
MHHRIVKHKLIGIAGILFTLALSLTADAAISEGPKYTNAVVAEQQRVLQFIQAEQSFQEKLKVGRQRYDEKQANRARIIAAMSAELQAREQTVVIQPVTVSAGNSVDPIAGSRPWLLVEAFAVGLVGLGYYLKRRREQDAVSYRR